MNKTVVIIGSIALLGVGAYFYFKPKAKGATGTGLTGTGLTGTGLTGAGLTDGGALGGGTIGTGATGVGGGSISVPPTGTVLATPEQVVDTAKKIAEAKSLATKISDLRTKRNSYLVISLKDYAVASGNEFWSNNERMLKTLKANDIAKFEKEIKDLDEKLGILGYMEVNGSITKIV
jgi:hypothetical protein